MTKIKPLFQWAGGKTKMIKHYDGIIPTSGYKTYVEPFFGGGAVFLWMKEKNPNMNFVINDINSELIGVYQSIKKDPKVFIDILDIWENAFFLLPEKKDRKNFYYSIRKLYWDPNFLQQYDKTSNGVGSSAILYFLMKTSFNGIWQTCLNSKGKFGTPAGLMNQKTKIFDKDNIMLWHNVLKDVDIKNEDYKVLDIPKNSLVYVDPPYVNSFTDYATSFTDEDQKKVIEWGNILKQDNCRVFLSNRDTDNNFICNMAGDSKIYKFPIKYTAGRRKKTVNGYEAKAATELLIDFKPA